MKKHRNANVIHMGLLHFFEAHMPHVPPHIQSTCPSKKRPHLSTFKKLTLFKLEIK